VNKWAEDCHKNIMTGFNVGARVRRDLCVSDIPNRLELPRALPEREEQISLSLNPGGAPLLVPYL